MTRDNILNMEHTAKIAPKLPYDIHSGVKITLEWMREFDHGK